MSANWPVAHLDRIARLRALAAGLPGTVMQERLVDAPFDDVWGFVSDLETSVPEFDHQVARVRIVRSAGEHLRIHTWGKGIPIPLAFDVTLRSGWAWMVSSPRLYVVGMAVVPDGGRTRVGHLEGPVVAGRPLRHLGGRPLRHHVARDLDGIERAMAARRRPGGRP